VDGREDEPRGRTLIALSAGGTLAALIAAILVIPSQLDPEPQAAAQIYAGGGWRRLSGLVETQRLSQLQSQALSEANARLGEQGDLSRL
jgi:hypothetical protein